MSCDSHTSTEVGLIDYLPWFFGNTPKIAASGYHRDLFRKSSGLFKRNQMHDAYDAAEETFTSEELSEFRQIFEFYDVDNSKTMDLQELERAMQSLGFNPTKQEVEEMMDIMDVDGDRAIDFGEFCMVVSYVKKKKGKYDKMREAFRCLDTQENGKINSEDFYKLMITHSDGMTSKQVAELIQFADQKGTGYIDYENLIRSMELEDDESSGYVRNDAVKEHQVSEHAQNKNAPTQQKEQLPAKKQSGEVVDTVWKAIGGPILLNSAIIITFSKSKPQRSKWPSFRKILKQKKPTVENIVQTLREKDHRE